MSHRVLIGSIAHPIENRHGGQKMQFRVGRKFGCKAQRVAACAERTEVQRSHLKLIFAVTPASGSIA